MKTSILTSIEMIQHIPSRLKEAFHLQERLNQQGVFFAPIRHHSPACAWSLKAYIQSLKPTHILIEAPDQFTPLIQDLTSTQTIPPVAIFAQADLKKAHTKKNEDSSLQQDEDIPQTIRSAYFPFCEYSPEWVALQEGKKLNAHLEFIDLDWATQCQFELHVYKEEQQTSEKKGYQRSLMEERYLAHSQFIQTLANALHCRNHDELWDHLFELQPISQLHQPQNFFNDVLTWCALARLDYEEDVLYRDASLHREYRMWQKIKAVMDQKEIENKKILVVTGGFHTLALIESLSAKNVKPYQLKAKDVQFTEDAWLIRYSFDRLDALNGYASGMPSPAYYQHCWQELNLSLNHTSLDNDHMTYDYLSQLCRKLEEKQALDITPYIALKNTSEIAKGLAHLRGHYRPSRYDLLDALQTALIKGEMDDGQHYLWQCIYDYLCGQSLGQVAKNQRSPALLQNIYQKAQSLRFKLDDTLTKNRKLDVYRKPLHQHISQFLHLLSFLNVGFAKRLSGPDFIQGIGLDLLFEEWEYAWTPTVEARLIELSEQGGELTWIAIQQLQHMQTQLQQQGLGQSASKTAELLAQACRLGLKQQLTIFQSQLNDYLKIDQNLASVISAGQQLFYLWHGRTLLHLPEQEFQQSILFAIHQSFYLLDQLYNTNEEKIDENLALLKQLHQLIRNVQDKFTLTSSAVNDLLDLFYQSIDVKQLDEHHLLKLRGAMDTLFYLDHRITHQQLQQNIQTAFALGSEPDQAVQYLQGVFYIAPEIFVQSDLAIQSLHQLVQHWEDETFIQLLPDLRFMFSQLNPKQSQYIADKIADFTGLTQHLNLADIHLDISEQEMLYGTQLNHELKQLLRYDGFIH